MQAECTSITSGKGRGYLLASNDVITFFRSTNQLDFAEMEQGYLAGPPLHLHPEQDEMHYLVRGKLRYQVGEATIDLEAGNDIHLPKGVPHRWINLQHEAARIVAVLTPGGSEGFFKTLASQTLDATAQLQLAQDYATEIVGDPFAIALGLIAP